MIYGGGCIDGGCAGTRGGFRKSSSGSSSHVSIVRVPVTVRGSFTANGGDDGTVYNWAPSHRDCTDANSPFCTLGASADTSKRVGRTSPACHAAFMHATMYAATSRTRLCVRRICARVLLVSWECTAFSSPRRVNHLGYETTSSPVPCNAASGVFPARLRVNAKARRSVCICGGTFRFSEPTSCE